MSPVKYELGFYIAEDGFLHSDRRENLKCYNNLRGTAIMNKGTALNSSHCRLSLL
jgi:hypothetical protein